MAAEENRTPERCRATQAGERDREAVASPSERKRARGEANSLWGHHVGKVKEFWFASLRSATNLYSILGVKKNWWFRDFQAHVCYINSVIRIARN